VTISQRCQLNADGKHEMRDAVMPCKKIKGLLPSETEAILTSAP
jgi:hypothetical protein